MKFGVAGRVLWSFEHEFSLNLVFSGEWEIRIETTFRLRAAEELLVIDPEEGLARSAEFLDALIGRAVDTAEVSERGLLTLAFEGGVVISVEPDTRYEAWTVAGPAGVKLVCMPGGEVAVWAAAPDGS